MVREGPHVVDGLILPFPLLTRYSSAQVNKVRAILADK